MNSYEQEFELWRNTKQKLFEQINQPQLPLILFGKTSAIQPDFLSQITVPVEYICDNDPEKWNTVLWDKSVISPDSIPYTAYNVLILVPFEKEISEQLHSLSNPPQQIFCIDLYFESENTAAYYQSHEQDISFILSQLADEESRQVFESVIRYRINRSPSYLSKVSRPRYTQYFPSELGGKSFFTTNEIFVDCGAFIGDTVSEMIQKTNHQYQAIYAFEPDPSNYQKLLAQHGKTQKITCYPYGVGEKTETLSFYSDSSGSKVCDSGSTSISIVSLDQILDGIPVTYLKMDIEGMECSALSGAKQLIQKYRPKLAICTYHSDHDMIEVPKLILSLNPDYRLYFRHYSHTSVETICYAI